MNGFSLYVRTRTKVLDYRFIGKVQPDRWWEDGFGKWTDFSRPTIIVQPGRFFIAGIASPGRTDSRGAGIHYAIAAVVDPTEQAANEASAVIRHLCERVGRPGGWRELGQKLDEIDEETWIAAARGNEAASENIIASVKEKLTVAARETLTAAPLEHQSSIRPDRWISGESEANFIKLGKTAAAVVRSDRLNLAAYLNLASESELNPIYRKYNLAGVICPDGGNFRPKG